MKNILTHVSIIHYCLICLLLDYDYQKITYRKLVVAFKNSDRAKALQLLCYANYDIPSNVTALCGKMLFILI